MISHNPRETRRQLRQRHTLPLISPPPRESAGPVVAFALVGGLVGLWGILYLTARLAEVMTASGR